MKPTTKLLAHILAAIILFITFVLPVTLLFSGNANLPTSEIYLSPGAPVNGTNEVQTLTFDNAINGGKYVLGFGDDTTQVINWSATDADLLANLQTNLNGLPQIGSHGTACAAGTLSSGHGTVLVTFSGPRVAKLDVPQITVAKNSLTGTTHTLTVSTTTAGVTADGRKAFQGNFLLDTVHGQLYVNGHDGPNVNWGGAKLITPTPTATATATATSTPTPTP